MCKCLYLLTNDLDVSGKQNKQIRQCHAHQRHSAPSLDSSSRVYCIAFNKNQHTHIIHGTKPKWYLSYPFLEVRKTAGEATSTNESSLAMKYASLLNGSSQCRNHFLLMRHIADLLRTTRFHHVISEKMVRHTIFQPKAKLHLLLEHLHRFPLWRS